MARDRSRGDPLRVRIRAGCDRRAGLEKVTPADEPAGEASESDLRDG